MTVIMCGQSDVLGDGCPGCGGWLHVERRGGCPGEHGWFYCTEDCIADHREMIVRRHIDSHIGTRDLLCECPKICAPRGLPTAAMRQEYADYLATLNLCVECGVNPVTAPGAECADCQRNS
jgi:hypothetical protein